MLVDRKEAALTAAMLVVEGAAHTAAKFADPEAFAPRHCHVAWLLGALD